MIPNANIEALEKAPPTKASNNPKTPELALWLRLLNLLGSIPGNTMKEPRRYMKSKRIVKVIFLRSSSMLQIFFKVDMNFFTEFYYLELSKNKKRHN